MRTAAALVLLLTAACAKSAPPASSPSPAPAAQPTYEDAAAKARADEAVVTLAARLEAIDAECRKDVTRGELACSAESSAEMARDYQAYFGDHDDPRSERGRFDALPRLGGPAVEVETVSARIEHVCKERCDLARRTELADRKSEEMRKAREARAAEKASIEAHEALVAARTPSGGTACLPECQACTAPRTPPKMVCFPCRGKCPTAGCVLGN